MFKFLKKDPIKKLEKSYAQINEKIMLAQRKGDIELAGELSYKAQEVLKQIQDLKDEEEAG